MEEPLLNGEIQKSLSIGVWAYDEADFCLQTAVNAKHMKEVCRPSPS